MSISGSCTFEVNQYLALGGNGREGTYDILAVRNNLHLLDEGEDLVKETFSSLHDLNSSMRISLRFGSAELAECELTIETWFRTSQSRWRRWTSIIIVSVSRWWWSSPRIEPRRTSRLERRRSSVISGWRWPFIVSRRSRWVRIVVSRWWWSSTVTHTDY